MADRKTRVLIVEDEAVVAVDIEQGLSSTGYEICGTAASGKEAIQKAEKELPDVVIMDIRLQGKMTGIEAAQEIRLRTRIPVVFLTAHSDEATIQSAKAAQPFGYLLKPFGVRELRAAIETALYKAAADRAVAESERWSKAIVAAAQNAFVAMDSEGRIIDWNPCASATFGYSREEALGRSYFDLVVPARFRGAVEETIRKLGGHGSSQVANRLVEQYGLRRDGTEIPIELSISSTKVNDGVRVFAFITDISRRKQLELQKARAEELERANKDLERFAHLASHDLQEPLRTISMYTQLLGETLRGKTSEAESGMMSHIVEGARRMSRLVDELLNFSRVGTRETFQLGRTAAEDPLKGATDSLAGLIRESHAKIDHDPLPEVLGNRTQLEQLFQNLLSNSIKFRGASPPEIRISATRLGEFWRFLVQDNGMGFDMKYAGQVFEMFRRVHSDKNIPGTGAGLAICRKIVSLHGGRIWAESEPGKGTKIFFTLPALEPIETRGALSGMRILVVDDDEEAEALLAHLLNGTGASLAYAENGLKGLEMVKAADFDLVLMDIEMPGISGIEIALRMKREGIRTPVIAFTNSDVAGLKERAPAEAFAGFLSKTMPSRLLVDHLHMWYAQS